MSAQNVHAMVTRSNGWWAISVDEIPGLFSQARRLDQVEAMVRDAASMLDFEVADVEIVPVLDADAQEMLNELAEVRREAEERQKAASDLTRCVIKRFRGEGLTLRDIASLVGLSQQRVSVLMREG